jgi:hypothetical protein
VWILPTKKKVKETHKTHKKPILTNKTNGTHIITIYSKAVSSHNKCNNNIERRIVEVGSTVSK